MENNTTNENMKGSKKPYVVAIMLALALVVTITATSYAYFSATVSGTGNNTVVTTTSLEIEFTDGPAVSLQNALPGQYIEKTFKVENKGNGDTTYDVYMSDLINDFEDKTDLVYTLTSNDGGYNVSTNTQVPSSSSKIVNAQLLRAGEAHNYTLRISFLETNDNQDDNKGKQFSTIIRVNEVHEFKNTITFNVNEGQELQINTMELRSGEAYGRLPMPVRINYDFDGWYTQASGGDKVESTDIFNLNSDQTLYAHWKESTDGILYLVKDGEVLFEPYFYDGTWDSNMITSSTSDGYWNVQTKPDKYIGTIILPERYCFLIEGYSESTYNTFYYSEALASPKNPVEKKLFDKEEIYWHSEDATPGSRLYFYFRYLTHIKNLWYKDSNEWGDC